MAKKVNRNVVLISGSIMQLFLGVLYIWSIFVAPVTDYFAMDIADVKLTSSFMLCFFAIGVLFGGKFQEKYNTQKTVLIGGVLLAIAMFSSAALPQSMGTWIYFTYGIMGGFGVGMAYNAIISTAQRNFPDRRGFATGISVCTFGFSTVIFAPLIDSLSKILGLQMTFVVLGVIFLIATIGCFSFIAMPLDVATASSSATSEKDLSTKEMLKTSSFYFITISMMFGISVYFILNPSFKSLALDRGVSDSMATLMIMLTGVSNALGRLFFPMLSDKIGRSITAVVELAITAIGAVLMIFVTEYMLMAVVIMITFCYGGISGTFSIITGKLFGLRNVGSNYGCVLIGFAAAALIFPVLLNPIENPAILFSTLGLIAFVGILLLIPVVKKEKEIN